MLPEKGTSLSMVRNIFRDTLRACKELGVTLCGGHTEITRGLERPIVVGQMLGEVGKSKLVRKESQRPGDLLLLTRGIAIEGTAILAKEEGATLACKLPRKTLRQAQRLLFHPGISIVEDAMLAQRHGEIHAMHDPTEGGLASGLYELAKAGGVGLRVWKDKVPVLEETRRFSEILGFDPFALIASGALLVVASPNSTPNLLRAYIRHGVRAAIIGEVREAGEGIQVVENGRQSPLRVPARDEIARLLQQMDRKWDEFQSQAAPLAGFRERCGGGFDPHVTDCKARQLTDEAAPTSNRRTAQKSPKSIWHRHTSVVY
jgi:hydrogenase maturation factor